MKKIFFILLYILLSPTINAESRPDTLEKQIFWSVVAITSDKGLFLSPPNYCLDNKCRVERSLTIEQNHEMIFHELARQAFSCKYSLENDYDFSYKKTAVIVRKIAAIESKEKERSRIARILDSNLNLSKYMKITCEKSLRRLKNLNDPAIKNKENDEIAARNLKLIQKIKPLYCNNFEVLSRCLSDISKSKKYEKIKQMALEIDADDGVSEINIPTLKQDN